MGGNPATGYDWCSSALREVPSAAMIEPIYTALGATVRALRRNRGMDQRQLADHLGYQRVSSISDLEHGRFRLQVHQLVQLAEIFEVSPQALLSGSVEGEQGRAMAVKDTAWREY